MIDISSAKASYLYWYYRSGQYAWEDHWPRSGVWKGTSGGEAISFSGCDDDQTSADTSVSSRSTPLQVIAVISMCHSLNYEASLFRGLLADHLFMQFLVYYLFDQVCFALLQPTVIHSIWFNWICSDQALSKITSTGAMTFCFIQAIERGQGTTYGSILNSMRSTIRNTGDSAGVGGGAVTSLITMLLTGGSLSAGGLRQVNSWAWYEVRQFIQVIVSVSYW